MLQTIMIIVGVITIFLQKVNLSKTSEIRRPRTIIFGAIVIVSALSVSLIDTKENLYNDASLVSILLNSLMFFVPIVAALFLKQPKNVDSQA